MEVTVEPIDFDKEIVGMAITFGIGFKDLWARTSTPDALLPYILYPDRTVWEHIASLVSVHSDGTLGNIVASEQGGLSQTSMLAGQLGLYSERLGLNDLQAAATVALMKKLARQLPAPQAEPVG